MQILFQIGERIAELRLHRFNANRRRSEMVILVLNLAFDITGLPINFIDRGNQLAQMCRIAQIGTL